VSDVWNYPGANEARNFDLPTKNSYICEISKESAHTNPLLKIIEFSNGMFGNTGSEPCLTANSDRSGGASKNFAASIEKLNKHDEINNELADIEIVDCFESEKGSVGPIGTKPANEKVDSAIENEESPLVITSSGKYSCVKCPKVFNSMNSFVKHLDKHDGKSTCPLCQSQFSTQRNMLVHLHIKHYSDQTQISSLKESGKWCEICKVEVVNASRHISTWHLDWFTCPVCKLKFSMKLEMLTHLLHVHTERK